MCWTPSPRVCSVERPKVLPFPDSYALLFWQDVVPLDLHSFPTRRSSDLNAAAPLRPSRERILASASRACLRSRPSNSRSEEHTSELQSRPHLVCRLLPEKTNRDWE